MTAWREDNQPRGIGKSFETVAEEKQRTGCSLEDSPRAKRETASQNRRKTFAVGAPRPKVTEVNMARKKR